MNNSIVSVFTYTDKEIRTVMIDGEAWFVAKDVCDMLDISNSHDALNRLPISMKATSVLPTQFGDKEMNIINEAGVYKLAFSSRKPEAEAFTEFVAGTILPTIRKTGSYQAKPMSHLEILAESAKALVEHEKRLSLVEKKQDVVIEALTTPVIDDWESQIKNKVLTIIKHRGYVYQTYWQELYIKLEATARVDLSARKNNKIKRMKDAGCKSKEYNAVSKLSIIASDPQLKAIFEDIVRMETARLAVESIGGEDHGKAV